MQKPRLTSLQQATYGLAFAIMLGWILVKGQSILLPVMISIISVYILTACSDTLGKIGPFKSLSSRFRRGIVLLAFTVGLLALLAFLTTATQVISKAIPTYGENFGKLSDQIVAILGLSQSPNWTAIQEMISDKIDIGYVLGFAVSSLSGFGTVIIAAIFYSIFLMADIKGLPEKTVQALGDRDTAETTMKIVRDVNERIGQYLMAKTGVNIILAVISLIVMKVLGIEFALFWAVLIGLLNYIPYIGSIIGVLFPVALSLVQFGSFTSALIALVALMAAQSYVGYVLEPRVLGKSVNLSPFVVLLSLAFWSALWGAIGAILAVPLTAMLMIIMAAIPGTRPIAVMLSDDGIV